MNEATYATSQGDLAMEIKSNMAPAGEVFSELASYRDRLDSLELAVSRVFETFGAVMDAPENDRAAGPEQLRTPRAIPTSRVGCELVESNERLTRLVATLHAACESSRL